MHEANERVFISSTVHDLIDLRAEFGHHLSELGVEPILAERAGFVGQRDATARETAIELCLKRVEDANVVFVIVDARYGEPLADYGGVSATQLECQHAYEKDKQTFVFVRDRVMAAKATWAKAGRVEGEYWPVRATDAPRLFAWIEQLERDERWISQFRDSLDLKGRASSILARQASRAVIRAGIESGTIPVLHLKCRCVTRIPNQRLEYAVTVLETERPPLRDVMVTLADIGQASVDLIPRVKTQVFKITVPWRGNQHTYQGIATKATIEFTTEQGQRVRQVFDAQIDTGTNKTKLEQISLVERSTFEIV